MCEFPRLHPVVEDPVAAKAVLFAIASLPKRIYDHLIKGATATQRKASCCRLLYFQVSLLKIAKYIDFTRVSENKQSHTCEIAVISSQTTFANL